jgi:hypothetical protein
VRRIESDEFHDVEDHAEAAQTSAAGSLVLCPCRSCPRLTIKMPAANGRAAHPCVTPLTVRGARRQSQFSGSRLLAMLMTASD